MDQKVECMRISNEYCIALGNIFACETDYLQGYPYRLFTVSSQIRAGIVFCRAVGQVHFRSRQDQHI